MTSFRKTMLSLAVAAAVGGAVTSAQAVNYPADKLGDVVLPSYYTVRDAWQTLLHLVNTSNTHTVALRVRFQEAQLSRDVLDFTLVLSPNDVWTGWVQETNGEPRLYSMDGSCTVPKADLVNVGYEFRTDSLPDDDNSIERTMEGHITVIEMGATNSGAVHTAAVKKDCATIDGAFSSKLGTSGAIPINATSNEFGEPLNIIKASYSMIRLEKGLSWGGSPTVLANFFTPCSSSATDPTACPNNTTALTSTNALNLVDGAVGAAGTGGGGVVTNYGVRNLIMAQTEPADYLLPTLRDARPWLSIVEDDSVGKNQRPRVSAWTNGVDAVSAVLMSTNVLNEWSNNPGNGVQTYWVVTLPTMLHYKDKDAQPTLADIAAMRVKPNTVYPAYVGRSTPFATAACETVSYIVYDRQENGIVPDATALSPSKTKGYCNEVTVFSFNPTANLLASEVGLAINVTGLTQDSAGWMNFVLPTSSPLVGTNIIPASGEGTTTLSYGGLPVTGAMFWSRDFGQDKTKNYGHAVDHAYKRDISANSSRTVTTTP